MLVADHPAVQLARKSVDTIKRAHNWLQPGQAENIISVEVTYRTMDTLLYCEDIHAFIRDRRIYGALKLFGIRFYQVDRLENGDDWRVLNALGTR